MSIQSVVLPDGGRILLDEERDLERWMRLLTSQHASQPKFMAMIAAVLTPFARISSTVRGMTAIFDLDDAVGHQLDVIGLWVGANRYVSQPLTGVYFELDNPELGLDAGTLQGPNDPDTGLIALPDDAYRTYLRAQISANAWDGTIPGAYAVFDVMFAGRGYGLLMQDGNDMTVLFALVGSTPDALTLQLLIQGYLDLKSAGVRITEYMTPFESRPYFGLDMDTSIIGGLDVGAFGTVYEGQ